MAKSPLIHPTALIEKGVRIGPHTSVWSHVHIRANARIGHHCIVGEKTYIACGVVIGNYVKINSFVYLPAGVTVENKVMLSAGCVFINDKFPRAFDERKKRLLSSEPTADTLKTKVREGATIGASATILGGLEIGRHALVGAGSVVTKSVLSHAMVAGNPARQIGWVCVCGRPLLLRKKRANTAACRHCLRKCFLGQA